MAKFRVYLVTGASCAVQVEADTKEEALEKVFEQALPYASAVDGFDLGEWDLASEAYPQFNKPEDDVEEIES